MPGQPIQYDGQGVGIDQSDIPAIGIHVPAGMDNYPVSLGPECSQAPYDILSRIGVVVVAFFCNTERVVQIYDNPLHFVLPERWCSSGD